MGVLLLLSAHFAHAAESESGTLQNLVEQWVDLQQEQAAAERSWHQHRPLLKEEAEMLKRQRSQLAEEIKALQDQADLKRAELHELHAREKSLGQTRSALETAIAETENRLRGMAVRLPPYARPKISDNLRRIECYRAKDVQAPALDERYNLCLSILQSLEDANNQIHADSIVLNHAEMGKIEMQALYIGLACAFAASPGGTQAATGQPDAAGWRWKWQDNIADAVQEALAVFHEESTAHFVKLPFSLYDLSSERTPPE